MSAPFIRSRPLSLATRRYAPDLRPQSEVQHTLAIALGKVAVTSVGSSEPSRVMAMGPRTRPLRR
jgi:hypothetical protein